MVPSSREAVLGDRAVERLSSVRVPPVLPSSTVISRRSARSTVRVEVVPASPAVGCSCMPSHPLSLGEPCCHQVNAIYPRCYKHVPLLSMLLGGALTGIFSSVEKH